MNIGEIEAFEREYFTTQNMTSREHQMYVCILWLLDSHRDLTRELDATKDELHVAYSSLEEVKDYEHSNRNTALKAILEKTNA